MDLSKSPDFSITDSDLILHALQCDEQMAMVVSDMQDAVCKWNKGAENLFGWKQEEIIGQSIRKLAASGEFCLFRDTRERLQAGEKIGEFEAICRSKSGKEFPVAIHFNPICDKDGQPLGIISQMRDITLRRNVLEHLQNANLRVRLHIEATPMGYLEYDGEGNIREWNPAAERIFGFSHNEMAGKKWMEHIVSPEDLPLVHNLIRSLAVEAPSRRNTQFNYHKDGRQILCEWYHSVMADDIGNILGFTSLVHDISAQSKAADELLSAKECAEEANRAKSEFLAHMSHDIRTPMNGILGCAELLAQDPLEEHQRRYLEIINNSGKNLLALINDILDLSRIETNRLELNRSWFPRDRWLTRTTRIFQIEAQSKQLSFSVTVDPSVPSFLFGDRDKLNQILGNIIGNAIKFTDKGSVHCNVTAEPIPNVPFEITAPSTTTGDIQGYLLKMEVSDTGIGMTNQQLGRIFESFSQADPSIKSRFGGTGLGLVICKRMAEKMTGNVAVRSTIGKGSVFSVTLPVGGAIIANHAGNLLSQSETASGFQKIDNNLASQFPLKILVVDDIASNRLMLTRMIQQMGYCADQAKDGKEALDMIQSDGYDCILLDLQMPVMDGFGVVRQAREFNIHACNHAKPLQIIAVTADAMKGEREHCLEQGFDCYVTKPISIPALQSAIRLAAERLML